jgi:Uncharacterised nucleotidyltransferase
MFVDMEPEDQLCLMLARRDLSGEVRERTLQLLASPLRWPLFLEHANEYDICPIIYQSLETLGYRSVPDPIRTELAKIFGVNAIRCEVLGKETARILQLLGDAGIPVMPLKGIALAASLYHDPALRVCADIDILVPPPHAADAFHLIVAAGYQSEFTQSALLDLFVRYSKDCLLMRQDDICTYPLELHCALLWGGQLERDLLTKIWAQANRKTFHGVEAFALSEEWEFLYLTLHAARHGRSSLKWLVDVERKQPELILGQAWIDKQSFLIRRIEGNIAKSPSWLVRSVHIRFDFANSQGMWIQSSLEAVADIRWLGAQKLTSHVLDYEAASVAAKTPKIGVAPPAAAVLE